MKRIINIDNRKKYKKEGIRVNTKIHFLHNVDLNKNVSSVFQSTRRRRRKKRKKTSITGNHT